MKSYDFGLMPNVTRDAAFLEIENFQTQPGFQSSQFNLPFLFYFNLCLVHENLSLLCGRMICILTE